MYWWVTAADALGRLEAALDSAQTTLRTSVASTSWSGPAATRFAASVEDELARVRVLVGAAPAARVAVLRHVGAAEQALREVRHGG